MLFNNMHTQQKGTKYDVMQNQMLTAAYMYIQGASAAYLYDFLGLQI